MFLIGMCDIFLILYLTSITNIQPRTVLTIDDFYTLKVMHESLKTDKQKAEEALQDKLRQEKEAKENLLAKLDEKDSRVSDMEQSLLMSDAQREQINKDLQEKEDMLKAREELLKNLNKEIEQKEDERRKMEAVYQKELENTKKVMEVTQKRAEVLEGEALEAQSLANQMKKEADLAYKTADMAKEIQIKAVQLKEEALAAREKAEAEKQKALEEMKVAKLNEEKAQEKARELTQTVEEIKQNAEFAYKNNVVPYMQNIHVTYVSEAPSTTLKYERELTLLPIQIEGQIYVVFPSSQIGFKRKSDAPPDKLVVTYNGRRVKNGLINTDDDLIAIVVSEYKGKAQQPYSADVGVEQLMPALLSLRNNGNVAFSDKIRGLSDNYFIVNRDYLKKSRRDSLEFNVSGFRGTGLHAERVVLGDQLVDLNGRLIGIANDADHIIRIDTLKGWSEQVF